MRNYALISNSQRDVEFQYADFMENPEFSIALFKFNRLRVGMLRVVDKMHLRKNRLVKFFFFAPIFQNELDKNIKQSDSGEYAFIVTARAYEKYGLNLIEHLRIKYPNGKIILYIADLICTMQFSVPKAKKIFDLVCSFDEKDAENHNVCFVQEPFSTKLLSRIKNVDNPEFDITCVSAAKNRYDTIISIYEELRKRGLKCDFHIAGVKESEQKYRDEIHYGWVDFEEVLNHVTNSKCILEVVQKGEWSGTTRYSEAMLLGRNLLTNCKALNEPENKEANIFYFSEIDEIPFEKISTIQKTDMEKYRKKFSIESFLNTIEHHMLTMSNSHNSDVKSLT